MDGSFDRRADGGDVSGTSIVVIDDDYAMGLSCRKILAKSGYAVEVFEDGTKGLEAVLSRRPDLVVVDLKMPGISGMDVISRVHAADPDMVMVVITGYPTIGSAVEAIKAGAFDFLPKPFTPDELRLVVTRALGQRRLLLQSHRLELERQMLKRRFMTFVSHQLKSPLVAIRQYMDVLLRLEGAEAAAGQREEWLSRSRARCDQLVHLIEDWLTLSRAEFSELGQRRDPLDLRKMLAEVVDACEPQAELRQVSLDLTLPDGGLTVGGEAGWVGVLFTNLVENAIKYNRTGGRVSVAARMDRGDVCVAVTDTGRGIPEECRSLVFEEFFRVSDHGGQAPSGTGLGLAITRKIVTQLGGTINLESEVGVGSTFTVRLPLLSPESASPAGSEPEEALG
ncbi:MAG TPA: hybrid sensor histidine kinase/response regulator [Longimicrobiales bacterium]|nr:hybrid sensor histidine kinase/response regulator [Longimicrobiales bacterium]